MNKNSSYPNNKSRSTFLFILLLIILFLLPTLIRLNENNNRNEISNTTAYENSLENINSSNVENIIVEDSTNTQSKIELGSIPDYSGQPYISINNNVPYFEESDLITKSYESYGKLDNLGRCTGAIACVGKDLMPTEKRESISKVKPTRMACYEI